MPLWVWPVVLTDADWQKKKGAIAKIAGETGVGDALKAGQVAFQKIDFGVFDAGTLAPADRDTENLLERKAACKGYYNNSVVPARAKLKDIIDVAGKAAASFKKNKLVPSSSVKAAEAVHDAADLMWMRLKDNSGDFQEMMKTWDVIIELNKKKAAEEVKKIKVTIANLAKALQETAKEPTKDKWEKENTSAHQRCRSMCNTIRAVPGLKKQYWSTWQPFGNFYAKNVTVGGEEEKKQVLQLVKTVSGALKDFNSNYEKYLD